jgi:hypothetical protein
MPEIHHHHHHHHHHHNQPYNHDIGPGHNNIIRSDNISNNNNNNNAFQIFRHFLKIDINDNNVNNHYNNVTNEQKRFKIKPLQPSHLLLEKVVSILAEESHQPDPSFSPLTIPTIQSYKYMIESAALNQPIWSKQNHLGETFIYISNLHPDYAILESQSSFKLNCSFVSFHDTNYFLLYFGFCKQNIEIEFDEFIQQGKKIKFSDLFYMS